jgi:hypothetical protein
MAVMTTWMPQGYPIARYTRSKLEQQAQPKDLRDATARKENVETSVGARSRKWNATVDVHATVIVGWSAGRNKRCLAI